MNNRWLPSTNNDHQSSFILPSSLTSLATSPFDQSFSSAGEELPPLHSESKTTALTTLRKPPTTLNSYIPRSIPKDTHHHLDHFFYHQLLQEEQQQQSNNNNNINQINSTTTTTTTMNVYYYKQQSESTVPETKSTNRGLSELDEVVQQSSSMQESASSKKEIIEDKEKSILFCGFNQLNNLFAVGTEQGFYVYSTHNLKERTRMLFHGGIGIVEMLFKSNIFALVGGGPRPAFPNDRVILWEDSQKKCISEISTGNKPIKAVKLHKNLLVVVLEDQVVVYDHDIKERSRNSTTDNPNGICAISPDTENIVLAYPAIQTGIVTVEHLSFTDKKFYIKAHDSKISQIALNKDGTRVATASEKGTLLRVFDTTTKALIKEVRRGSKQAHIYSIAFSDDSNFLCCSSETGTIHVFSLVDKTQNRTSSFSFVGGYIASIFNSEWSFGEYRGGDDGLGGIPTLCSFAPRKDDEQTIAINVLSGRGEIITLTFDVGAGQTTPSKVEKKSFLSNEPQTMVPLPTTSSPNL